MGQVQRKKREMREIFGLARPKVTRCADDPLDWSVEAMSIRHTQDFANAIMAKVCASVFSHALESGVLDHLPDTDRKGLGDMAKAMGA